TLLAIAALALGCAALASWPALAQDDDWTVVTPQDEPRPAHQNHPSKAAPTAPAAPAANDDSQAAQQAPSAADGAHKVCGELARPAVEPYKSVVADIDRQWGVNAPVYESMQASSPHVSRGGCIFYNPIFMEVFLRGETDEHGEPDKTSMLYAIMAHELGHIEHHDYERKASSVEKELEADRFSGYTLERMGIPRANITPFYSLGGDEFSGVHDHGFSNERIAAFNQGWKAAEWNRPESGGNAGGGGASTDDSSTADDSAAAAAVP
ncbi:MAG TPA: hypothetical protein VGI29_00365, partial [Candidatus Binataceae bacterium]